MLNPRSSMEVVCERPRIVIQLATRGVSLLPGNRLRRRKEVSDARINWLRLNDQPHLMGQMPIDNADAVEVRSAQQHLAGKQTELGICGHYCSI